MPNNSSDVLSAFLGAMSFMTQMKGIAERDWIFQAASVFMLLVAIMLAEYK